MLRRRVIPHVVCNQTLRMLPPDATARQAAELMAAHGIGVVLVVRRGRLCGIVSERDLVSRVIAAERDVETTPLAEVMTADPEVLHPDAFAEQALQAMQRHHVRHLPVVRDGRPVGIVSIRDLYQVIHGALVDELAERDEMMFGGGYSVVRAVN